MTLTQKFLQATKNVPSWFFNNNGNEVDKTKIRLHDGSPVHSTGTTWLRSQWKEIGTANLLPLTPIIPHTIVSLIAANYGVIHGVIAHEKALNQTFNSSNMCINKSPENCPPTSLLNIYRSQQMVYKGLGLAIATPTITALASAFIGMDFAAYAIPYVAATSLQNINFAHRFSKVVKGDWIIEEMPKPIKKKSIADELGLDKLVQPEQKLVPIPIPPPRRD